MNTGITTDDAKILRDSHWSEHSRPLAVSTAQSHPDQVSPARTDASSQSENPLREQHADELTTVFEEARAHGYREGREIAQQECVVQLRGIESELKSRCDQRLSELDAMSATLAELIRQMEAERGQLAQEMEAVALEVAVAAVTKMLGASAARGELMRDLLKSALQEVDRNHPMRIRLSSADYESLTKSELISNLDFDSHAQFMSDDGLSPGACVIENARGSLDASLGIQLSAFRELLVAIYQSDRASATPHE